MKKILVIRFSSIGDIVLTSPVLRCVKQQMKDVEIHYLTKKAYASILENNPFVTKVYSIENDTSEVIAELQKENYDLVIDLHHNLRSAKIKRQLRKPSKSFNKLNLQKWLYVRLRINRLPQLHIVDRYMETVRSLGINNDQNGLDYFIPEKDLVSLSSLPVLHQAGYIGFVIGAKHFTKQLPVSKIISICTKLNQPIVLLGDKSDFEKGELIRKAIGERIYNSCGQYNLHQSASLVKQAQRIITHDTGLMHVAAAFEKDIISVWGNTIPAFGMSPYFPKNEKKGKIVEVKNLSCRPCSKIGYPQCPKGHFKCMMEIDENLFIS